MAAVRENSVAGVSRKMADIPSTNMKRDNKRWWE